MYCTNCGNEVAEKAIACAKCGVPPRLEKKFCWCCGCFQMVTVCRTKTVRLF
ncbi:MAG: zinc-ribbon domain-containing protein [Planctomycetes bacterium]|nr:zinc-ribbon domain-containing protein [Planctomycetota bacterium]MBT4028948.1 zinc-ribbon domain-containing protein [Planctomycetota bacterium]MBT4560700.1 zinc-ribbon domain-containing protein [Planctomycetota bacterium]MBT5101155.1 zinc-ribbon domain-containing protein [Planctomycetota bacterium]MBT7013196.1 zinc-ribbon domain-containing protein [Planctomycetota bacterium]